MRRPRTSLDPCTAKHGFDPRIKQRETIPKRYNSPPTPSETHASKPELPKEEEFEFLWNCLAGHFDFESWKRTRHFKSLLQPVLDEHGLESGLELLQNVLTAAAQCDYWGRKTTQSLAWFSDWHRWLPAVLKPANFERLSIEGAAFFEAKARRVDTKRAQKKADADQELVRQEVQSDYVDRMQEYREMLAETQAKAKAKNLKEKAEREKRSASL
ncbi:MAG: hypothetical protein GY822_31915 [Deltaproteobacteria bacterium]|nr:hypothetical protein [Deltaproteobacteria bacterium]